ncbi:LOW QUALITY PROTEIN: deoxyribodipyrimidine photo-lyase, partial [Micromonospora sp. M42]
DRPDGGRAVHPRPAGARPPGAGGRLFRVRAGGAALRARPGVAAALAEPHPLPAPEPGRPARGAAQARRRPGDQARRPGGRDGEAGPEGGRRGRRALRRLQPLRPQPGTRLRAECDRHRMFLRLFPGLKNTNEPGALRPSGGDHYRVFSPYFRAWQGVRLRDELAAPKRVRLPDGVDPGRLPDPPKGDSPAAAVGGENAARRRLTAWLPTLDRYDDIHDDMAGDETSRLSPYLRFGCVSPLAVATRAGDRDGPFVRQLCWRDFYHQVVAGFPDLSTAAYRRGAREDWRYDEHALDAWTEGRTGMPIVDAGMRQMRAEGWMHNRARLITAGYLTKHLGLDWRPGLEVFFRWLLDGDRVNNSGNWQWVAGTGNDTRPYRGFNPVRQAERYDPDGAYVRRWVPELESVAGKAVHQPWRLPDAVRRTLDYPPPLEVPGADPVWLR